MAKILGTDPESIKLAARELKNGKLVAIPTETVYGLGGNALMAETIARIFEVKKRPSFDPLIVHIDHLEALDLYCSSIRPEARLLAEKFWPGPLTLVLPKKQLIPDIVSAGLDTIAIRMPSHPIARQIISEAGVPIAAPSANLFSKLSPTLAEHVNKQIGDQIDYIVDGGKTTIGVESTVVFAGEGEIAVLRPGGLPIEEIEAVIGPVKKTPINDKVQSPGQLLIHYSPHTPLKIHDPNLPIELPDKNIGYLAFRHAPSIEAKHVEILSTKGDLVEAAANLFESLHRLDELNLDLILAEKIPETGLGQAIMDRLRKAAHK
ncbi:MAG: L-threonylcarbamoyladenylate synthase [Calditrichia bacterium]